MTNLSLASFKEKFGITDDANIKYEKKENEIILHIPLKIQYDSNEDITHNMKNLIRDRKEQGWSTEDFVADIIKLSNKNIHETFSTDEIQETIQDSFKRELEIAKFKRDRYTRSCKNYENKYSMTSNDFFSKFESGRLGEDDDYFDWYSAYRAVQIWNRKYQILLELSQ